MTNPVFKPAASPAPLISAPINVVYETLGDKYDDPWLLLIYGASGSGKSWFCGTAGARTLFINIGDGIVTIRSPLFRSLYPEAKDMILVNMNKQFPKRVNIEEAFDRMCKIIDHAILNRRAEFDTVVIDDASALKWYAMYKGIKEQESQNRSARPKTGFILTDIADKGKEIDVVNWFLREYTGIFRAQGLNFILTAHERRLMGKAPSIGEPRTLRAIKPGFTGETFPDDVPGYFDEVWHFTREGNQQEKWTRAHCSTTSMVTTKTRHNGIFRDFEDRPDFQKMLTRIKKGELVKKV